MTPKSYWPVSISNKDLSPARFCRTPAGIQEIILEKVAPNRNCKVSNRRPLNLIPR
jgi:hypothetical protein